MRLSVDERKCFGHGRCHMICPEVFALDDDGYVVLLQREVGDGLTARVMNALTNCPERAISAEVSPD